MESRSFIDTHVALWLLGGQRDLLSARAREAIQDVEDLWISPMVRFELEVLWEIGRITQPSAAVLADLQAQIGVRMADVSFDHVALVAASLSWTRDPFDRLIVGHAALYDAPLISKDRLIRKHYKNAVW